MFRAYTDGSCLKNPGGNGGVGCVYIDAEGTETGRFGQGYRATTNNRMELMAAWYALMAAHEAGSATVEIHSDSRYVVDGANKYIHKWRVTRFKNGQVKNLDLWKGVDFYLQRMRCTFVWVKAHNGDHYNEIVDKIAYEAAHAPTQIDVNYERNI
jgi:ribonuclease HI